MLTRAEKENIVSDLGEKFLRQKMTFFSNFRGIKVANAQKLRRLLMREQAEYVIAKKNLIALALQKSDIALDIKKFDGEIALTFVYNEDVNALKALVKFGKENPTFANLGGLLGSRVLDKSDVLSLSKLPPREVLLAQVLGAMQGVLQGFMNVLQGNMRNFVVVLDKIRGTKSEIRN